MNAVAVRRHEIRSCSGEPQCESLAAASERGDIPMLREKLEWNLLVVVLGAVVTKP